MEIGSVAKIVAYVLPGYVATELRNFVVRTRRRNDFERLASSLFLSLVAYALAVAVVRLSHSDDWESHITISLQNWWFVALLFSFALLLGYIIARATTSKRLQGRLRRHHVDMSEYPSVWNEIWHGEDGFTWVLVRMKDGSTAYGALRAYSADPDDSQRELWLYPVYDYDPADPERELRAIPGLSLYIPAEQIASVAVTRPADLARERAEAEVLADEELGQATHQGAGPLEESAHSGR